ncbi:MAG: flagellar protein FlgN [Sphingomonadaceae bacterium]|nr:flagellar protein FlgN [Sphingomonadaceae bacterium]
MLAVLQAERQAIATLNFDAILGTATDKQALCDQLSGPVSSQMDEECRGLLDATRRLNEVNRQVRNLVAANVSTRLDNLTGSPALYQISPAYGGAAA